MRIIALVQVRCPVRACRNEVPVETVDNITGLKDWDASKFSGNSGIKSLDVLVNDGQTDTCETVTSYPEVTSKSSVEL